MNIEILKAGGIEYEAGLTRFMGNAALYERVMKVFAADDVIKRARAAYDDGDMAGLLAAVHEAKGTSGNMELGEAYRLACCLVVLLRSDSYSGEEVEKSFLQFERVYLSAQECVRQAMS